MIYDIIAVKLTPNDVCWPVNDHNWLHLAPSQTSAYLGIFVWPLLVITESHSSKLTNYMTVLIILMAHLPNEPSKDSFVNDTFLSDHMTHLEQSSDDCTQSKIFINLS